MNPQNVLLGDVADSIDLPDGTPSDEVLVEEKAMAQYAKSPEFKRIRAHFEERIKFYQSYLPDGTPIKEIHPVGEDWRLANSLIAEFNAVINLYKYAEDAVEEAAKNG